MTDCPRNDRVAPGAALAALVAVHTLAVGCASSGAASPPPAVAEQAFTVGLVQKEIRVGMSQADVSVG